MGSCLLIINPSSGKANGAELLPIIENELHLRYTHIEVCFTKKKGDAEKFTKQAIRNQHESVYCVGGDGTIKEVVNGLMKNAGNLHLGIIPNGTVNDLARSLNIPLPAKKAIQTLSTTRLKQIDVGKVNDDYFISLIAIGGIAEAIQSVSVSAKTRWGALSYLVNGAFYALRQEPFRLTLTENDKEIQLTTSLVVVSLQNSVAGMTKFFKEAKADDGYLHTMVYPTFRMFGAAFYVWKIITGKIANSQSIKITKNTQLIIEAAKTDLPINIDGDQESQFPLHIEILAQSLSVFVP